jgi:hypothetical protein
MGTTGWNPVVVNWVTNILGLLLAIAEPLHAYFGSQSFNFLTFIICLATAVLAYFTGKTVLPNK